MSHRPDAAASEIFDVAVCGSLNLDLLARVSSLPRPGETVSGRSLVRLPGGKGLNQAIAAARLGARTAMLGAVGEDADGAMLCAMLAAEGVDTTHVLSRAGTATGLAQVFVADDGENSIVVHAGANGAFTPDEARQHTPHARVYLAQGEVPAESVQAFFEHAAGTGGLRILNTAPATPALNALCAQAELIVLNLTELATLTGGEPEALHGARLIAHARRLLVRSGQIVIVTQGAQGACVVRESAAESWPARSVEPVDTTGAGDCFCGALAAALASGCDVSEALPRAIAAASICITRPGAAPSMPTMIELEALLVRRSVDGT